MPGSGLENVHYSIINTSITVMTFCGIVESYFKIFSF